MNVIIPVAGIGKRLRPITYAIPKALVMVAGKRIIDHILEELQGIKLNKIVLIVGVMGEKIEKYIKEKYRFNSVFIEQQEQLGLGHAIWTTKEEVKDEPSIIIYGDTIFKGKIPLNLTCDGYIGVKEVKDPRRFGVVVESKGIITKLIEKPDTPISNLAIVGVNFISNMEMLFSALDKIIAENKRTKGEFQLTDAFQLMIEWKAKFKTFKIEKWYDCGTQEMVIKTNEELLKQEKEIKKRNIIPPVHIGKDVEIRDSVIGPNVTLGNRAKVISSKITNTIIGEEVIIENSVIDFSLIGDNCVIKGVTNSSLMLANHSKILPKK
jgi:glucose-1-phosphate thymidylyltransferase